MLTITRGRSQLLPGSPFHVIHKRTVASVDPGGMACDGTIASSSGSPPVQAPSRGFTETRTILGDRDKG